MPGLPQIILWTLGAIGLFLLMRLANREWQRLQAERVAVPVKNRKSFPTLRRDPVTGEYHL